MGIKFGHGSFFSHATSACSRLNNYSRPPCAFVRDYNHLDDYLKNNKFLAFLNNERQHDKMQIYKDRIKNLDYMLLV